MLSLGIAVLLAVHTYGPHSFLRLPWASPLRAFRLAVTGVVVAALGLGLHPRITVSRAGQPSGATRFVAWLLHTALLTGLVAALAVGRAAAAVLLDMASRPTAAAAPLAAANGGPKGMAPLPPARLSSVSALASGPYPCSARGVRLLRELSGQVAAPWVAGALLSYGMQAGLPYPSDARLPFNLCALGTVGLYLMTLQLRVHLGGHLSLDAGEALSHNHFRFKRSAAATRRH